MIALIGQTNYSQQPDNIKHYVVADEKGKFFGWSVINFGNYTTAHRCFNLDALSNC